MRETPRKLLALATLVAVLTVPSARTVLDAGATDRGVHVESTHHPDRCRVAHDHAACVQLFASAAAPSPDVASSPRLPDRPQVPGLHAGLLVTVPIPRDARPRGPPVRLA